MASFRQYEQSGGSGTGSFSIQTFSSDEIKVYVDNVLKTAGGSNHYTIESYTTNGGTVTWTTGNIPSNGSIIRIVRDTGVLTARATYAAGSSVKADDLNNNQTQVLRSLEEQDDQLIQTYDVQDSAITTAKIKADNITSALIADDQINSEHYVDGSIDTAHIANAQVTTAKIADSNVTTAKIADANVTTTKLADDSVTTAKLNDLAVTTAILAASSVTTAKLANDAVTNAKIADNSIDSEHYVDGSIDTAHLADNSVTGAKLAAGTIGTTDLADSAVTTAKISDANVTTAKIASDAINGTKIADDSINSEHYVDGSINTAHIADSQITTAKIAADAITNAKIADDSIDSEHYVDGSIDTAHIGATQVTDAKLASNAVTTSKITDANVTTVKVADSNITLAKLASDLKQTSISDSDTQLPTSGAVVDYVAAQIAPIGGLEVIATDAAFPNTQPSAGVVISIADAGGLVVNESGTSTTGRTVGGSTVTINNIASNFNSTTVDNGVAFMVSSTGSGQIYNYHKATLKEADLLSLSGDINDFAERYRVAGSAPSSSLDEGDLWWDTATDKLKVYDGSSWEEVASSGDFYINTISSYSGTGGNSATFDGTAYRFVLSNPGSSAQQHVVSINGVIQKPNSGTSQPSEGFVIDGSSIIFSNAPASGSDYFILTLGTTVSIGTPSDGTVTEAKIASGAVTTVKIADDAVTGAKIADDAINSEHYTDGSIDTAHIADDQVTAAKLADNAVVTAAINADAVTAAKIADDAVGSEHIEVLDAALQFGDSVKAQFGTGNDLEIYHNGSQSFIDDAGSGALRIRSNQILLEKYTGENLAKFTADGAVELYYDNSKKIETTAAGVLLASTDSVTAGSFVSTNSSTAFTAVDGGVGYFGTGLDLRIHHTSDQNYIDGRLGNIYIRSEDSVIIEKQDADGTNQENMARFLQDGAVELYYDDTKKFETIASGFTAYGDASTGSSIQGDLSLKKAGSGTTRIRWRGNEEDLLFNDNFKASFGSSADLQIYHNGTNSYISNDTGILYLRGADQYISNADGTENMARFQANGVVELYYDNVKTFSTRTEGIFVKYSIKLEEESGSEYYQLVTNSYGGLEFLNGTTKVCELTDSDTLDFPDNNKIQLGTGSDFTFWHDGTDSKIYNSTGDLYIQNSDSNTDAKISIRAKGGENSIQCFWNGAVSLYHNNSNKMETTTTGITVTGSVNETSDIALKENIQPLSNSLANLKQLNGYSYQFKDNGAKSLGLTAQEVEKVYPDLVTGEEGNKTLQYSGLIAPLLEAVKELSTKIETLETKVAALEAK